MQATHTLTERERERVMDANKEETVTLVPADEPGGLFEGFTPLARDLAFEEALAHRDPAAMLAKRAAEMEVELALGSPEEADALAEDIRERPEHQRAKIATLIHVWLYLAKALYHAHRTEEAIPVSRKALKLSEALGDHAIVYLSLKCLAGMQAHTERDADAMATIRTAHAYLAAHLGTTHPLTLKARSDVDLVAERLRYPNAHTN